MKKLILGLVLLAFIMLGTISVAKATTVTFYVQITLSDTCSPSPYHGYYYVKLDLEYNSNVLCTSQNCAVIQGTYCYAFTCDVDALASDSFYGVKFLGAARYPSGDCPTTSGNNSGDIFSWPEMTHSTCGYAWISVTL